MERGILALATPALACWDTQGCRQAGKHRLSAEAVEQCRVGSVLLQGFGQGFQEGFVARLVWKVQTVRLDAPAKHAESAEWL